MTEISLEDPNDAIVKARAESARKQVELKASWREEWLRRKREQVVVAIKELSDGSVREIELALISQLVAKNAHPSVIKRLQTNGWDHPLVRHLMIDYFAAGSLGEGWDQPSTEDLLDIASESPTGPAQLRELLASGARNKDLIRA
jgi:hypothetical protein